MAVQRNQRTLWEELFAVKTPQKGSLLSDGLTKSQQHCIRKAADCLSRILIFCRTLPLIEFSSFDLARFISDKMHAAGADSHPLIFISPEHLIWHGLPCRKPFKEGQVVSVDIACSFGGWWADAAWTFPVGEIDEERRRLLRGAWMATRWVAQSLQVGEDGKGISPWIRQFSQVADLRLIAEAAGHGIGTSLHQSPLFTYDGRIFEALEAGHVYSAEPIFTTGSGEIFLGENTSAQTSDAAPTAHFEVSVFVDAQGPQLLGLEDWFEQAPCL